MGREVTRSIGGRSGAAGAASGRAAAASPRRGDGRTYAGESLSARRRDQRARLIAAARAIFAEQGFGGASIEAIVARAHVSRTTFYRFFSGKEECMLAVYESAMRALAERFAAAAASRDPEQRVRVGVEAIVEGLAADPVTAQVVMVEAVGAGPAVERARVETRRQFASLLEAEMRRIPAWRRRPDREVELTAMATIAAVAETVSFHVSAGRAAEWRDLVDPLIEFALRALTPERARIPQR
jgi:AcrR family transcriptional regulator